MSVSDNLSDRLPVIIKIELSLSNTRPKSNVTQPPGVNWSRLSNDTKILYESTIKASLDSINIPFHSLLHDNHICDNVDHILCIEKYFHDIINAIAVADECLPKSRPKLSKGYWNGDLSEKKRASFDA